MKSHTLLASVFAVPATVMAAPVAAQVISVDIAEQPASSAIPEIARQFGVDVIAASTTLADVRTNAVRGQLEVEAILDRMFRGTGVGWTRSRSGVYTLNPMRRKIAAVTLAAPMPDTITPSAADESPAEPVAGEEILVTARRRDEAAQTVPVAVTALGGKALERGSIRDVQDLTRSAPSVTFGVSSRGASVPFFSIRGISTFDVTGTLDPTIGIYMNDVIQQRPNGVLASFYDMKSVQILRGPQGTLFGRNTIGGAILVSTQTPTDRLEGYLQARAGNYDLRGVEGAVNIPVAEGLRARFAGFRTKRDGYVISGTTGQALSDQNDWGVRGSVAWEPFDGFVTTTVASYYRNNGNGIGTVTPGLYPVGAFTAGIIINANSQVADAGNRAAIAAAGLYSAQRPYRNLANEIQFDRTRAFDVSNTSVLELTDRLKLKNIFGYRHVRSHQNFDTDASAARVQSLETTNNFKQLTEEVQILGHFDKFDFIAGLYYFRERGTDFNSAYTGVPLARIDNPASRSTTGGLITNTSYSAFGSLTYKFTDRLTASAGARYTKDRRKVDLRSFTTNLPLSTPTVVCNVGPTTSIVPGGGPNGETLVTQAVTAPPCHLPNSAKFDDITYSFDVNYKAADGLFFYAAHRRGYNAGAFNARAIVSVQSNIAGSETLKDVEIGMKSDLRVGGMPVRFNVAAYYGWYDDIKRQLQLPAVILNGAPRTITSLSNTATAHISGIEIENMLRPLPGLEISSFFAYNRTNYTNFIDLSFTPPLNRKNDLFGYAPKYTGSVTVRYTRNIIQLDSEAAIQLNYFSTSRFNFQMSNQPIYTIVKGYDLINVRLELNKIAGSGIDAALFVNNLTDRKYFTGGHATASVGVASYSVGAPRMYGLQLRYSF